jgi:hypothetical protein
VKFAKVQFVIKEDLHEEKKVHMVKRFAHVIIEHRCREGSGKVLHEMRALNFNDKIYAGWISILSCSMFLNDLSENEMDENPLLSSQL